MSRQTLSTDNASLPVKGMAGKFTASAPWASGRHAKFSRLIIYPKDIQWITGKSERYGRVMIQKIKQHFNKEEHQLVTIHEFCAYAGLGVEEVMAFIG